MAPSSERPIRLVLLSDCLRVELVSYRILYHLELLPGTTGRFAKCTSSTSDLWLYLLRFVLLLVLLVLLVRLLVLLCPSSTPVKLQSSRAWSHSRFRSIRAEHPFIGVEMLQSLPTRGHLSNESHGNTGRFAKFFSWNYWTFRQIQTNLMELLDVSPNSSHGTTGRFVKFLYYPLAITFILVFLNT